MDTFLLQIFIFLASAAIAVPIAKKMGLGSVLGYLLAGIVIGPFGLSLIHNNEKIMHFTEFGVVMMLFLVGLELKPALLWSMKVSILGVGGLQVLVTSTLVSLIASYYLPWQQSLAIGLTLALSSTAIVLQILREKRLLKTKLGKSVFSVLLFQDLAVIPILIVLPFLANIEIPQEIVHQSALYDINSLPGYMQLIVTLLALLFIFFLGRFASKPIFRAIALSGLREVFVASALALVVGISLLMIVVGLSPALGTFLAGVVLADSEYRHELESNIEPFKGLLLGIFFMSVGASLDFNLISSNIFLIVKLVFVLVLLKFLILLMIGFFFKMQRNERSLFAIALSQGGEFAFVLFQASKINGVLPNTVVDPLMSAVVISMFLSPLLFLAVERLISTPQNEQESRQWDKIENKGHKTIMAGFGRLGKDLGRFLISAGINLVIVDHDPNNVAFLRKLGFEVYYGDITRLDLLESAGVAEAELLVITIGDIEKCKELASLAKKHYPNLKIVVSAHDRSAQYDLMDLDVQHIRMKTFGSAIDLGQDALEVLGVDPYEAYRKGRLFRKMDKEMVPLLYKISREDEKNYITSYQNHNKNLEKLLNFDKYMNDLESMDTAWTTREPQTPEDLPKA